MSIDGKHYSIVTAAIAAAALALGTISAAAETPDSSGAAATLHASDAAVAARVKNALRSSTVDSRHINVAVVQGDVHLQGFVQDNRDLLAANEVASKAAGDRKIVNELIIKQNYPNAP